MLAALVAHRRTPTNVGLARGRPGTQILAPAEALRNLGGGDFAIGRLDVSEHVDGIEVGLWELARLEGAGVRVLNRPRALVAAHDKLATSRVLLDAGIRHPRTAHLTSPSSPIPFEPPVVVKPRFGSWGRDVTLCEDAAALRRHLAQIVHRRWFKTHGALVQELVPPQGEDVRIVVAGGTVVGAVRRIAAPGEWRTNVALGATRCPTTPTPDTCELAVAAARAIEADLVGVDLLPAPEGGHVVIELNGAVEFNEQYALTDEDIYERTMTALLGERIAAVA
jgi:[lysine-biosynthesis-protein LysW]--L-2-aminoadipate ligase